MAPLFHMEALLPSSIAPQIDSVLHAHVFRAVARLRALLVDLLTRKRSAAMRYGHAAAASYYRRWSRCGGKRSKIASSSRGHHLAHYDHPAWNVVVPVVAGPDDEEVLGGGDGTAECGYLCWLEEERRRSSTGADDVDAAGEGGGDYVGDRGAAVNEIDRLAEKFIARLHAMFLQEKQESYRRYQDMMARSV